MRVLLTGSEPIETFDVRLCSERCWKVPLMLKSLVKSYCQLTPNMDFLSIAYSDWLSSETFTDVPASMML